MAFAPMRGLEQPDLRVRRDGRMQPPGFGDLFASRVGETVIVALRLWAVPGEIGAHVIIEDRVFFGEIAA